MKQLFAIGGRRAAAGRQIWSGGAALLVMLIFVAMAEGGTFSKMPAGVARARSFAGPYLEGGRLPAVAKFYLTCAEYLFVPESGAGARLHLDLDE